MGYATYLKTWLLPPGINFLIIILGYLLYFFLQRLGKTLIFMGVLSLYLLSTPIVAYYLLDTLQNAYPILKIPPIKTNADFIIVLGGGSTTQKEYNNRTYVSDYTLNRLSYAAYLAKYTQLPILVSGGKYKYASLSEADLMAEALQNNFQTKATYREDKSRTTADESRFIIPLMQQKNLKKAYLVTDAWHMPRSVYIFHCQGISVIPAPMGHKVYGPGYAAISFYPSMQALSASYIAIHEYLGLGWYYLKYHRTCHS